MYERNFRANGKLLLTGEYFVLDGAKALALPTQLGQQLHVRTTHDFDYLLYWQSLDVEKKCWFECILNTQTFEIIETSDWEVAARLLDMFKVIKALNIYIFNEKQGFRINTTLEFPRDWGLGSSSTLIYNLAQWCEVDPYVLLANTMGGSGYDIACAGVKQAIVYERNNDFSDYTRVNFNPDFLENIYFVYLGKKQNSRDGIASYRAIKTPKQGAIEEINALTAATLDCKNLSDFEKIMQSHEILVADLLGLTRAQDLYFSDYFGTIKSLGAWGGDFVLATSDRSEAETFDYFHKKGFQTVLPYHQIILNA